MNIRRYCSFVLSGLTMALLVITVGFLYPSSLQAASYSSGSNQYNHQQTPGYVAPKTMKNQNHATHPQNYYDQSSQPDYRVMVYIRMRDINHGSLNELRASGVSITHVSERYKVVTGYVAYDRMTSLTYLRSVLNVQIAQQPLLNPKTIKPTPGKGGVNGPITGPFHN